MIRALEPYAVPCVLAIVLGALVGLEREQRGRPAGLRTHILVCLSATLVVCVSNQVPSSLAGEGAARVVLDPNRIGAGVLTGIGFLGAATVIRVGDLVRGITTAACIWYVAGLGIVLGLGHYLLAVVATLLVLVVLVVFDQLSHSLRPIRYRNLVVHGTVDAFDAVSVSVRGVLDGYGARIQDLAGSTEGGHFELSYNVRVREHLGATEVLRQVAALPGVDRVEWSRLVH